LISGGQRYQPRLVREVEDVVKHEHLKTVNPAQEPLSLQAQQVSVITEALYGVTQEGTSRQAFIGANYKSGGKTGTAQAVSLRAGEKYNASKVEEHKRDHSLYIAFAPVETPTIALAVIVENAGFGSTSAAPIARRVFDYLLLGQYPSEEDIALTQIGRSTAPVGKPRSAALVLLPGTPAAIAAASGASR
jgi:penicillin-binding protein 2